LFEEQEEAGLAIDVEYHKERRRGFRRPVSPHLAGIISLFKSRMYSTICDLIHASIQAAEILYRLGLVKPVGDVVKFEVQDSAARQ